MNTASAILGYSLGLLVVGWLIGGRLRNLARIQWRFGYGFICIGILAGLSRFAPQALVVPLFVLAVVMTALLLSKNIGVSKGVAVLLLGALLNMTAVLLHGFMPVTHEARAALGSATGVSPDAKHRLTAGGITQTLIGDSLPVPELEMVVSVGDVLLLVGASVVLLDGLSGREQLQQSGMKNGGGE